MSHVTRLDATRPYSAVSSATWPTSEKRGLTQTLTIGDVNWIEIRAGTAMGTSAPSAGIFRMF